MVYDEEMPKRIKYDCEIWKYNNNDYEYYNEDGLGLFREFLESGYINYIQDDVIVLEEEKKIPEKLEYYDDSIAWVIDNVGQLSDVDKVIIDKLNDVIDYLKSKGE